MKERDEMKKNEADRERRASAAKSGKDEKAGDRKGATERRSLETRMCSGGYCVAAVGFGIKKSDHTTMGPTDRSSVCVCDCCCQQCVRNIFNCECRRCLARGAESGPQIQIAGERI